MSGQILVVDNLLLSRMVLRVKLSAACYETSLAATGAEALAAVAERIPDIVILDCNLPDIAGVALCSQLRTLPRLQHVPIILIAASQSPSIRLQALAAGAAEVLAKPMDETFLLSRIRALLRLSAAERDCQRHATPTMRHGMAEAAAQFQTRPSVALVCDTVQEARQIRAGLSGALSGQIFDVVVPVAELLKSGAGSPMPDILLLSPQVLGRHGPNIVADLRARPGTSALPIAALLAEGYDRAGAACLDLGAEEVLDLKLDAEEIRLRIAAMIRRKHRLDAHRRALGAELDLAARDALTGLSNRRFAMSRLSDLVTMMPGHPPQGFGLLMIDLDNFKRINDNFGHLAGDEVLSEVGARMQEVIGTRDVLARYGGEEFILILPGADGAQTRYMAEAVRAQIEERPFRLTEGGYQITVTASIGMTVQPPAATDPTLTTLEQIRRIIEKADSALRVAKATGRNRVSLCDSAVA